MAHPLSAQLSVPQQIQFLRVNTLSMLDDKARQAISLLSLYSQPLQNINLYGHTIRFALIHENSVFI